MERRECGRREREREREKRHVDQLIQSNMDGREGTEMLETKIQAAALLLTPTAPEGRGRYSLRPKPHPKRKVKNF